MGGRWFRVFCFSIFSLSLQYFHFLSSFFLIPSLLLVLHSSFHFKNKQTNKHTLDFFHGILGCKSSSWASFFTLVYIFMNEYLFMFFTCFFSIALPSPFFCSSSSWPPCWSFRHGSQHSSPSLLIYSSLWSPCWSLGCDHFICLLVIVLDVNHCQIFYLFLLVMVTLLVL